MIKQKALSDSEGRDLAKPERVWKLFLLAKN